MNSFVSKVVIIGESGVGKSSILDIIRGEKFNSSTTSTIGIDWYCLKREKNNILYKFHIYDTSGQEAYSSITNQYYRDAKIIIFVYSLNNLQSLKRLTYWENEFDKKNLEENPLKIFVASKCELKNIDNISLINQLKERNIQHIETSSKDNINIKVLEKMITDDYINNHLDYKKVEKKYYINNLPEIKIESDCYVKFDDKKDKNNCC